MKVTINIDCTPGEARAFLGLPDMEGLHADAMAALKTRISDAISTMDPEALLNTWMPGGMKGFEDIQKAFWSGYGGNAESGKKDT